MAVRRKLLLVDDDEAVIEFLGLKLGAEFDIVSTMHPEKALDLAREHRPDVVLCDIDIPGMDGGDISAALFGDVRTHGIPVVFLTALVSPQDLAAKGNQLAGRAAVSKDSPIDEIRARILAALQ